MFMMASSSILITASETLLRVMKQLDMPSLPLMGACFGINSVMISIWLLLKRPATPETTDETTPESTRFKYFLCSSTFMMLSVSSLLVSVHVGTSLGDISALASVNVVMAALFGRLFLGEPLEMRHVFAAVVAAMGALLISKPSVIFSNASTPGNVGMAWLGYVLAPLSGFFDACFFVVSRKAPETSPTLTALSLRTNVRCPRAPSAHAACGGRAIDLDRTDALEMRRVSYASRRN